MALRANVVVFLGFCFNKEQDQRKVCMCVFGRGGRRWAWRGKTELRIKEATEYKINHLLGKKKNRNKNKHLPVHTHTHRHA